MFVGFAPEIVHDPWAHMVMRGDGDAWRDCVGQADVRAKSGKLSLTTLLKIARSLMIASTLPYWLQRISFLIFL